MKRHYYLFFLLICSSLIFSCQKDNLGYYPSYGDPYPTPATGPEIWPYINQPYDAYLDGSQSFTINDVLVFKVYTNVYQDTIVSCSLTFTDYNNGDLPLSTIDFTPLEGNPNITSGIDFNGGYSQPYLLINVPLNSNLIDKTVGLSVYMQGFYSEGTGTLPCAFRVTQ